MPVCFGASRSVRASTKNHCAQCASDVHTFWPLITHSSPSGLGARSARSRGRSPRRARSSPGTRSSVPARMPGRNRRFCSSLPKCTIVGPSRPSPTMPTRPGPAGAGVLLVEDDLLEQGRVRARRTRPATTGRSSRRARAPAPTRAAPRRARARRPGRRVRARPRTDRRAASVSHSRASARKFSSSAEKYRSTPGVSPIGALAGRTGSRSGRVADLRGSRFACRLPIRENLAFATTPGVAPWQGAPT